MKATASILVALLWAMAAHGQLVVTVSPPKVVGQKAVVPFALRNGLAEKVESARAVCFLLDEQGRVLAQATRCVIGGNQDNPGLQPGATNAFHFVITRDQPSTTTNLTVKISFSRVVLEGGRLADITKDVSVTPAK